LEANYSDSYIRETVPQDVTDLAANLRDQDTEEILGLGVKPADAIKYSFANSKRQHCMRTNDEKLVCCFGVGDGPNNTGVIWCLGTPFVKNVHHTFLKHSKEWLNYLMDGYFYVYNMISESNTVSMRWLQWLGAEFTEDNAPQGYRYFTIRREAA
jgi:hypothetical protein